MGKILNFILGGTIVLLVIVLILILAQAAMASPYISNFETLSLKNINPARAGVWKRTPTVIVCPNAPLVKGEAEKAVKFWENLGYRFFRTQYKYDPLNKCNQTDPVGYIVIHLVKQDLKMADDTLAVTHFYVDNDHKEVEWAVIYIKSNIEETVLEHEIGHALGFLHYNKINHLMNQKWAQGGWDTEGLSARRR
tara:strand:- start:706 stop:1287 length:582 start_codon:yes stop_codon:yes gene_type:complete